MVGMVLGTKVFMAVIGVNIEDSGRRGSGGGSVEWLSLSQKVFGAELEQEEAAHVHLAVPLRPRPVVSSRKTIG
jgi:hypothetical protein